MTGDSGMVGHNSRATLESDSRRARFFTHMNPIWELEQQRVEIVAQITKAKRTAKADGFESYEINQGLEIRKAEKPETVDNQMARKMAVLKFMNQPAGYQFNFLDEDRTPDTERAYNEGISAGLREETPNNPFGQGTPQYGAYEDGWRDGQDQLGSEMQKRMEDENARNEAEAEKKTKGEARAAEGETAPKRGRGRPKLSDAEKAERKKAKGANGKNGTASPTPAPEPGDEHAAAKAEDAKSFGEESRDPFPAA